MRLTLWLPLCAALVVLPVGHSQVVAPPSGVPHLPPGFHFPPPIISPQMESDGQVTFRLLAPHAEAVTLDGDILDAIPGRTQVSPSPAPAVVPPSPTPATGTQSQPVPPGLPAGFHLPRGVDMTKGGDGIWSTTIHLKPGAWRYHFTVDGVETVDPNNTNVAPSQTRLQNVVYVPGDFSETRDVPHGAVSRIRYIAKTLNNAQREMYVYTPPGYDKSDETYPVLYLIHGGGDTAIDWSTVGRANDILDNLLAEHKAKPMIIVMPSGWTPLGGQVMTSDATKDPFNDELLKDIMPFVDANFRTKPGPENRALSGLSMGGIQTLNIGLHNLGTFRYVAVMSSGWISPADRDFFYEHEANKIPLYNSELKLFWWGWGQTDIARSNGLAIMEEFKKRGVTITTLETPGGHNWINWRLYLHEVAPLLFQ
jgi:enterochelin esterase-like enzyme